MRKNLVILSLFAAALLAAAPGRLFKAFDFEERPLGNVEDVPMHWSKLVGPGLPHYVTGKLTNDRARNGQYSFRMDLDGGNCGYQYDPHRLPVSVGGHYRFSAFCQTTPLKHARARITLGLADLTGELMPGTEVRSEVYASPAAADGDGAPEWHALSCELTDDNPDAAFLIVRVELVQPARYATTTLGDRSLFPEDIHGTAWFDDLVVAQVPRVSLATERPANVFRRIDPPQLTATLSDPSTDDLASQLVVADADGRQVFQRTGTVDLSTADPAGPGRRRITVPLPIVPAGWYRATLRLATPGHGGSADDPAAFTGYQSLDFVQLAEEGVLARPDRRFGMVVFGRPDPALADVLPLLSAGRVKLDVTADDVNELVDRLNARGIAPVGRLPLSLTDPTNLIGRHLGQIDRWQLGADDTEAFVMPDPSARRAYAATLAAAVKLTPHPDLAMPVPLGFDPPAGKGQPAQVALFVPPSIQPNEIQSYLKDVTDRAAKGGPAVASMSLRPAGGDTLAARAAGLVQRLAYAASAGVDRVDLPLPLAGNGSPTEMFPVERTVLSLLSGGIPRGRLPVSDGVEAFLFERNEPSPGAHGVALLWSDAGDERFVTLRLGDALVVTDLWGNATPLAASSADGAVTMRVGPVPVILTGVDAPLARFRAGLAFDAPTLESVLQRPQVRRLHVTNPYGQPIAGVVRVRPPAGWTVSPPVVRFELNPGESIDRDLGITLPMNARAGRNVVRADVELQADHPRQMTLDLPMQVGLNDVGVQATAFRDGGGNAIVVQQRITNYGEKPVDYTAYVSYPGLPRVERFITKLEPGKSVLKRYHFAGTPGEVHIRTGVKETDGPHVLNEEVTVP